MPNNKNKKDKTKLGYQIKPGKFCLNMIVKNEAHFVEEDIKNPSLQRISVIQRCLDNVGHLIDAIAIVDTGSTDQTIEIINNWAEEKKIPCQVIVDPWRDDFGYSRTYALRHGAVVVERIKQKEFKYSPADDCDWYFLFMDADNLTYSSDNTTPIQVNKDRLGADAYEVQMKQNGSQYAYVWLIKVDPKKIWKWYGPLHEFISPLKDQENKVTWQAKFGKIEGGYIESRREGSRSNDVRKYLRDAIIFEKVLLDDPNNDRYLYYLAQSYKDAATTFSKQGFEEKKTADNKDLTQEERNKADVKYRQLTQQAAILWQRAEKAYVYRASTPPFHHWNDEYTYCAWVEAGKIRRHRKGKYDAKCIEYFCQAHQKRPHRLEAAYYILNNYLQIEAYRVGWSFAKELVKLPYPKDEHIFVDENIHQYSFIFEASLCAYYSEAKDEFIFLSKKVLRNSTTPDNIREATKNNLAKFGK